MTFIFKDPIQLKNNSNLNTFRFKMPLITIKKLTRDVLKPGFCRSLSAETEALLIGYN